MTSPLLCERRLDHLVTDAATGQTMRGTEYSGVMWIGGEPPTGGMFFGRSVPVAKARVASVLLPDSLPYLDPEATVVTQTWVSSGPGDPNPIIIAGQAELVPDPRGARVYWVQLTIRVAGSVPAGIGYRVVVEVHPDKVG
ncbi:hypothetical protein [Kibdelosporangium phytohabitans]|uniref:Uncharacterized protein n=1 Tax=Kibdelosporangium phytohabitans TaxID=860235 RepID=A0A0N9IGC6_9PSEU|nr:hypothetical protein [Kibdelosporangium phytohabitans]ALG13906.1 hypothetical protein AOZ06_49835 [Kibdelosporangium phytohabitans]MBE1467158.1 hypothetical protein [Kibdelosporangium phytohabitans]